MTNTATGSTPRNVVPSEVGWQFVPQYYTFVNKQPDRLHLFYTKKSTFIHGVEGEDGKPCHGQQEIHQKITSLGYNDCKVFIHSVDAQSSADGGIIIQVIGEMSNQNEDWRKFVQTFFLAEQPNGYFVLNDIFRFLKEETVESDEAREGSDSELIPAQPSAPPAEPVAVVEPPKPVAREPTPPPVVRPATPVEEPPTTVSDIPASPPMPSVSPRPNGVHVHLEEKQAEVLIEKVKSPPRSSTATPAVAAPTPPPPQQIQPPAAPTPPPATPPAQAPAAPQPQVPPAPKTWANLAAANSKKWGSAVAQESRGTSEVVPQSSSTGSGTQTPTSSAPPAVQIPASGAQGAGGQAARNVHPAVAAAHTLTTAQCFIKGVIEPISQSSLSSYLIARFGPIKEIDIVRSKACAFVEFTTLDAARRAIITSLPQSQGGEGGLWVDTGDGGQIRISVETRKERGDRPAPRPRGGAPPTPTSGDSNRGGGAGTGGSGFRGRGGGARGARGMGGK